VKDVLGTTGLILNEPLLWEKGKPGRRGFSLPPRDVEVCLIEESLASHGPDFPDLSEVDVVRHFTRLSTWNFGVDTGTYPLGSCTMKYNPKINDKCAACRGLPPLTPFFRKRSPRGF
jgi:glycine dehydrogenase subunit 2